MLQLQELSDALDEIETGPRVNTKLSKLKRDLEADYQKSLLEIVDKEDVNLLKRYFNRLLDKEDLTIPEIVKELNEYIDNSDNLPYSDLVKKIIVDLESGQIEREKFEDFMAKFVNQNYPIDIFYKRYFGLKTPSPSPVVLSTLEAPKPSSSPQKVVTMTDIFGDELEDLSSSSEDDSDEEEKLQKVRDRIEEKREEPRIVQVVAPQPQKKRGKITVVQDDVPIPRPRIPQPKPIAEKIFFETMADVSKQDCEFLYRKIPWVKDIVNHIYVHPIEGNFDGILDFENIGFQYDDGNGEVKKFYSPKKKYYFIQCHSNKIQKGNELTIVKNGETYKLMVAIDTNTRGIVFQNEDMLKAEIDFVRVWNQNKGDHIKEIKRHLPNEDMILLAKYDLSSALQDAIGIKGQTVPIAYRSSTSQFIETVVQTILKNSNSGESFVRLLSNIIIFLKINLSFITSSVFIKRLREQIYLPGTLPFLTDADKLPEIFLVKNVPEDTRNFVLEKLEEERVKFTKNFFENLHIGSSLIRKPTQPILWNKPTLQIELPNIKTICKNKDQIEDENDEDIVFYTDLDEVYCFNVYKLYDLFREEETPINPYTQRPFSDGFIQIFLTRYASKPLVKKIEHTKSDDLTSKLETLIEQELSLLENKLIETENPEFIERFKSSITPPTPPIETKRISHITDHTKCMECKKDLGSDKIGSVFRNKQVFFCGYDCLEKNKAFK